MPQGTSIGLALEQGARISIGAHEAGGIADPAVDQILQPALGVVIQHAGAAQGVQIAIGVETQLARAVVPMGKLLARVAERLEMADGVGMFEHGKGTTALGPF